MATIETRKKIKLKDLVEGKIFDEDELIIESDESRFTTLRRENEGESIRRYRYDYVVKDGKIVHINNNRYGDFYHGEAEFREYDKMLKARRLCDGV